MHTAFNMAILSRLRFKQLVLVTSLVETRNLHVSAKVLNLSQPGATKLLKEVEATLGVELFGRKAKGMEPTAFGLAVARHAQQIIAETGRLTAQVEAIRRGEMGKVRLGAIMEAGPGVLAQVLTTLAQSGAGPSVDLTVSTSDHLIAGLNDGSLDLALGRPVEQLDMTGIQFEPFWQEQLSVVAAPDHKLLGQQGVGLEHLQAYDWILQPRPSPMRTSIELAFARVGLPTPRCKVETASMLMTTILVSRTDKLAVLPQSVARHYIQNGFVRDVPVPMEGLMGRYGLLRPIKKQPDPAIDAVVQLIRHVAHTQSK